MGQLEELLNDYKEMPTPQDRLDLLRRLERDYGGDDRIKAMRLWWDARYAFVDKKKTRVQDKYVWLIVHFANHTRGNFRGNKELIDTYANALECPELTEAQAFSDQLYEQLMDAANIYVETLRLPRPLLGFQIFGGGKDAKATNQRVSKEVVQFGLLPIAFYARERPLAGLLIKAIFAAAKAAYTGIQPVLLDAIDLVEDEPCRSFILQSVRDTSLGDF